MPLPSIPVVIFDAPQALRLKPSRWPLVLASALESLSILLFMGGVAAAVPPLGDSALADRLVPMVMVVGSQMMLIAALFVTVLTRQMGLREHAHVVRLTVTTGGLFVDGAIVAAREALTARYLAPCDALGRMRVELHRRRRGVIVLVLGTHDQGRSLLRSLGLDVTPRDATFRLPSRLVLLNGFGGGNTVFALIQVTMFAATWLGAPPQILFVAWPSLIVCFFILRAAPTKLHVSPQGVGIRWLLYRRFVSYRERMTLDGSCFRRAGTGLLGMLSLPLLSGRVWDIPVSSAGEVDSMQGAMIWERVREASLLDVPR